jgi:divalent metal cation (Fe/Co/Zn/Cd) transporter
LYESIRKIVVKETIEYLGASLSVMIVSIILTMILVTFQRYVVNKTQDLVVKSDMLHYKTDLFSNA